MTEMEAANQFSQWEYRGNHAHSLTQMSSVSTVKETERMGKWKGGGGGGGGVGGGDAGTSYYYYYSCSTTTTKHYHALIRGNAMPALIWYILT